MAEKKQAEGIDPQLMKLHGSTEAVNLNALTLSQGLKVDSPEAEELREYYNKLKAAQQTARDKGLTK